MKTLLQIMAILVFTNACVQAKELKTEYQTTSQLYAQCQDDIKVKEFNKTKCGAYLDGFRASFYVSTIGMMSEALKGQDNEFINEIAELRSKCNIFDIPLSTAAKGFIEFVQEDQTAIESKELPASFLWEYFLHCGETITNSQTEKE
ncbi:MAG: hypothetical protein R3E13_11970 [Alphaproteobacteria bacterium]